MIKAGVQLSINIYLCHPIGLKVLGKDTESKNKKSTHYTVISNYCFDIWDLLFSQNKLSLDIDTCLKSILN